MMLRAALACLLFVLPGCDFTWPAQAHAQVRSSYAGGDASGGGRRRRRTSGGCASVSGGAVLDFNAETLALSLANNDPVTSWANDGSIGGSLAQATSSAQPTFQSVCTGIGGAGSCVSFDGGDSMRESTASTSLFAELHDADDQTVYIVHEVSSAGDGGNNVVMATVSSGNPGIVIQHANTASTSGHNFRYRVFTTSGASVLSGDASGTGENFLFDQGSVLTVAWDYGSAGDDAVTEVDGAQIFSEDEAATPTSADHALPLTIGGNPSNYPASSGLFTGYIYRIVIYSALHDAATIAANVDALDCALGGTGWPK